MLEDGSRARARSHPLHCRNVKVARQFPADYEKKNRLGGLKAMRSLQRMRAFAAKVCPG